MIDIPSSKQDQSPDVGLLAAYLLIITYCLICWLAIALAVVYLWHLVIPIH